VYAAASLPHSPSSFPRAGDKRAAATYFSYNVGTRTSTSNGYELLSNAAKGTVTLALSKTEDPTHTSAVNLTQCSVTFKLIAGYAFDLTPPAGAVCPPPAVSVTLGGRSFCNFCPAGSYLASTGECLYCPAGSYQDQAGSSSCKKCPAGSYCGAGTASFLKCQTGFYSKAGAAECMACPANTFGNMTATACTSCPKFTQAPASSSACSVPFLE
jgi:hypothetical protein